jgi:hypothetical protein
LFGSAVNRFAYVEFAEPSFVTNAMVLDESLFRGRLLKVSPSQYTLQSLSLSESVPQPRARSRSRDDPRWLRLPAASWSWNVSRSRPWLLDFPSFSPTSFPHPILLCSLARCSPLHISCIERFPSRIHLALLKDHRNHTDERSTSNTLTERSSLPLANLNSLLSDPAGG